MKVKEFVTKQYPSKQNYQVCLFANSKWKFNSNVLEEKMVE